MIFSIMMQARKYENSCHIKQKKNKAFRARDMVSFDDDSGLILLIFSMNILYSSVEPHSD